jgi:NADH:ubiquinone oxidoreductase subunit 3 (subunit A)
MKNLGPALISVLLSIVLTSIVASVLIPILDNALSSISQDTRTWMALGILVVLLIMVAGFAVLIFDLLQKRAEKQEKEKAEASAEAEDPDVSEDSDIERKPAVAFIVLAVICAALFAYEFIFSTSSNTNISFHIGENVAYGTIIFFGFAHFLGKHLTRNQKSFAFVVIVASLTSGGYFTAERRSQAETESLARMQDNLLSILEDTDSEDGRMTPLAPSPDASEAQGELAILEANLTEYLNQVIANNNDYITELDAIGFNNLLDADRIRSDTDLSESQFINERALAIVDKYEELNIQAAYDYRDGAIDWGISAASLESFQTSFDKRLETSLEQAKQIWELERQVVNQIDELVRFLSLSQSSWTIEDDQYAFYTDKNRDIFNSFVDQISEASAQQEAIKAESANTTREIFDGTSN